MTLSRREVLEGFTGRRIRVVGDVMLDEYAFGDAHRLSPDAPVPVVSLERRELRLGGAGNVARNLEALGACPNLVAAVGADPEGARVRALADEAGVAHALVEVPGRPTTHKLRVVGRNQHVVRLDREVTSWLDERASEALFQRATALPAPALLVLSDYAKGVLSPGLLARLFRWAAGREVPVLVDPKNADFTRYFGATFLTPNAAEAFAATGISTATREGALAACRRMRALTGAKGILLTRGEAGMALVTGDTARFIAARRRRVFDVTGAGDTVIATFGLCLASGASLEDAMALANIAAGVVVGKVGAAACGYEELARECGLAGPSSGGGDLDVQERLRPPGLLNREDAAAFAARCRAEGRKVVFTNGCYDVLHAGHVVLLEEARTRGDVLIVGLNSDASVRRLKGPARPAQPLSDRARILCALKAVDAVVPFDEDTPLQTILALRPDVLVKGGDYRFETIVGAPEVAGWGGEVTVVPTVADRSTTRILTRARPPAA